MLHLQLDDRLGLLGGFAARAPVLIDHLFQIIDRIQKYVVEPRHGGFDVARHRKVEQEHRALAALLQGSAHHVVAQYRVAAGGGGKHDVGLGQVAVQIIQRQGHTAEARGERLRMFQRAVGHQQAFDVLVGQVPGCELDGVAGTDQQHCGAIQRGKHLLCQPHRGKRHRYRMAADGSIGPHSLGHREGLLEEPVQRRLEGAAVARGLPGFLHLSEDLWFAEHE